MCRLRFVRKQCFFIDGARMVLQYVIARNFCHSANMQIVCILGGMFHITQGHRDLYRRPTSGSRCTRCSYPPFHKRESISRPMIVFGGCRCLRGSCERSVGSRVLPFSVLPMPFYFGNRSTETSRCINRIKECGRGNWIQSEAVVLETLIYNTVI